MTGSMPSTESTRCSPMRRPCSPRHVTMDCGSYTRHTSGTSSACPPRPFEPRDAEGKPTFSDAANPLSEICREVAPAAGEPVFRKNDASAFSEAGLAAALRGAEWVFVAGVWTEACVAATVRDAIAAGHRVLVVKDACGSGTAAMHETAVLNLANRLYGGGVCDTARAVELMAGGSAGVWMPPRPAPILFTYESAADHYRSL